MKIAIIGQKGIPALSGGVETHVENLAVGLVNLGHEISVYTRPNYTNKNLKEYKGVRLISIPSITSKHFDAISHTFFACLDLIFRRKVDIIHFHSIGPSSMILLIKIFKPFTPIVATYHSQCYKHQKWNKFAKAYLKFGEHMICKYADSVIAVSKNLKKYALDNNGRIATYIPNGVSKVNAVAPKIIKKWGLNKDNYIFTATRLVKHKGIHYLIEAFNNLDTDKKLVIAGGSSFTDDYVDYLKKLAGDNKNIIFTGNQTGATLNELFSNAYIFVQPSESEGLSFSLLEGMSYGAVLVSDIPENLEAINKSGFSFKNKDIKDLENKLRYLFNNKRLVNEMRKKGSERVKEFYNWDMITRDTVKIYKELNCRKSYTTKTKRNFKEVSI